jgi:type II secretory pathway component PulK
MDVDKRMMATSRRAKGRRGVVLPLVLILSLVLATAVTTFLNRAVIDTMIVRNRDKVAVAEALARSGVHIARAVLQEQLTRKIDAAFQRIESDEVFGNTEFDLIARVGDYELTTVEGATLRVSIFDNRSRLNLNSLVRYSTAETAHGVDLEKALALDELGAEGTAAILESLAAEEALKAEQGEDEDEKKQPGDTDGGKLEELESILGKDEGKPIPDAEEFLVDFLDRVIENMDASAENKEYDSRELARNLIDYMDHDTTRIGGGDEDEYYLRQDPPYLPANKPLLSVQEVGLVEGFDHRLARSLEPYLTVYPLFAAEGININTAPGHVLGSMYQGSGGARRLLSEDDVVRILDARDQGEFFCEDTSIDPDRCITLAEADIEDSLYPPTSMPAKSLVYTVLAQVSYGDIERSVEAVINMTQTGTDAPFLLYWRMQ